MAVAAKVVLGVLPTGTSALDFTSSGFGTPDAAIIFIGGNTVAGGSPSDNAYQSVGLWDGTTAVGISVASQHNAGQSNCNRGQNPSGMVRLVNDGTAQEIEVSAASADGITLTSVDNTAAFRCAVLLLKGLTNAAVGSISLGTGISAINVTEPGFRADLVFLIGNGHTSTSYGSTTSALLSFGAAHINSSDSVAQGWTCLYGQDNQTDSNATSYINSNGAGGQATSSLTYALSVSANSSGFAVTPSATAGGDYIFYLALELPDPDDAYVAIKDIATGSGGAAYTGAGFTPIALILAQTACTATNSISDGAGVALGVTDGTTQRAVGYCDEDSQAATDTQSQYADAVLDLCLQTGAAEAQATISSFDADGWTLSYSDYASTARKMLAVAIGSTGGGTTTTVAPSTGHVTLTGYTPTVTRTDHKVLAPSAGHLTYTGYVPTVTRSDHKVLAPSTGHLTYTGYVPSVSRGATTTVAPSTGHVTFTGYAPTVTRTAHRVIAPLTGHVAFTGYAPTVVRSDHRVIAPSTGHLSYTGYAPSISQALTTTVSPSTGHITYTGYVPTLSQTQHRVIEPQTGHLTVTGYAPVLSQSDHHVLAPSTGHITYTGHAPTVAISVPGTGASAEEVAAAVWATEVEPGLTALEALQMVLRILRNKTITDSATGLMTIYESDGATPFLTAALYQDAAGTTPYAGAGAERREELAPGN